jgi:hypothetical protein
MPSRVRSMSPPRFNDLEDRPERKVLGVALVYTCPNGQTWRTGIAVRQIRRNERAR